MNASISFDDAFTCSDCEDFSDGIALKAINYIFYLWFSALISAGFVLAIEMSIIYLIKCSTAENKYTALQKCMSIVINLTQRGLKIKILRVLG